MVKSPFKMKGFSGFGSPLQKRGAKELVEEHASRVSKKRTKIDSTKVVKNKSSKSKQEGWGGMTQGVTDALTAPKRTKRLTKPSVDQTFIPSSAGGTTRERFNTAFSSARSAGKKTFEFEGKMYTTKVK